MYCHKGDYVDLANLKFRNSDDTLNTGVIRAYRRRRIALALKVHAIPYTKTHGHPGIRTWNATTNLGMLAINECLRFVKGPTQITFVRVLEGHPKA